METCSLELSVPIIPIVGLPTGNWLLWMVMGWEHKGLCHVSFAKGHAGLSLSLVILLLWKKG